MTARIGCGVWLRDDGPLWRNKAVGSVDCDDVSHVVIIVDSSMQRMEVLEVLEIAKIQYCDYS